MTRDRAWKQLHQIRERREVRARRAWTDANNRVKTLEKEIDELENRDVSQKRLRQQLSVDFHARARDVPADRIVIAELLQCYQDHKDAAAQLQSKRERALVRREAIAKDCTILEQNYRDRRRATQAADELCLRQVEDTRRRYARRDDEPIDE